ncbi:hypothetical protein [Photobacterium halotolerans]|uniref:hypothetical protein n=1 Tax=Photobacterium halotolerans TaxID=265726 RepID=UPI00048126C2|nr:hypothetical protein [Photobacterium halotolerans]
MSDYPSFYPEDIPPEDAEPAEGLAFRLVMQNPPTKKCFQSSYEENPNRAARTPQTREMLYGTSLFRDKDVALTKRRLYKALRSKLLSTGVLDEEHGVMKKTGKEEDNHITVWFKDEAQPQERFECIEE